MTNSSALPHDNNLNDKKIQHNHKLETFDREENRDYNICLALALKTLKVLGKLFIESRHIDKTRQYEISFDEVEDIQNWIETTLIKLSWNFSKNKSISEIISGNRKLAYLLSEILNLYIDNPYHDIYVASGCIEPYCTSFVECINDYREIEKYEIPPKSTLTATRDALEQLLETSNLNIHDEHMHLKNVLGELKKNLFNCWEADNQWKLRAWLDDILEEYGLRG